LRRLKAEAALRKETMMSDKIKLAINGACGRMGRYVISGASANDKFKIVSAIDSADNPMKGRDAGAVAGIDAIGVEISDTLTAQADVMIDFSIPDASMERLEECKSSGVAMVIATTGLTAADEEKIEQASQTIPILKAANMSLGINYLLKLAAQSARALGESFDIEIVEMHHKHKKDSPSGTALALGRSIADALGEDLSEIAEHGREGIVGERKCGKIGFHAVRGGDVVGDHTVIYAGQGERIELTHKATSREVFAQGALRAAAFLAGREPGLYTMSQVLGL